ncbi:MAG: hypothetical protein VKJ04_07105 [Vampirovibrionales bacterium]|nr:hypothetical protein [Vampirovibrionales bacterium]
MRVNSPAIHAFRQAVNGIRVHYHPSLQTLRVHSDMLKIPLGDHRTLDVHDLLLTPEVKRVISNAVRQPPSVYVERLAQALAGLLENVSPKAPDDVARRVLSAMGADLLPNGALIGDKLAFVHGFVRPTVNPRVLDGNQAALLAPESTFTVPVICRHVVLLEDALHNLGLPPEVVRYVVRLGRNGHKPKLNLPPISQRRLPLANPFSGEAA